MTSDELGKKLDEKFDAFAVRLLRHLATKEELQDVRSDLKHLEAKVDIIQSSVDNMYDLLETEINERAVMSHQLDKHEGWITKAAPKLDITYNRTS